MDVQNYKKLYKVYFDNCKILKIHTKNILNPQKNFIFVLSERKCGKIEQQLKVKKEDTILV